MSGDAPSKFCCRGICRLTNTVRLCFARDPQFCCRWRRGVMATKSIVRGEPIVVVPHNMVRSCYSRTRTPSILLSIYLSYHPAPLSPSSPNWNSLFLSFHGLPSPSFSFSLPPSLPPSLLPSLPLPLFFPLPKNTRKHINLSTLDAKSRAGFERRHSKADGACARPCPLPQARFDTLPYVSRHIHIHLSHLERFDRLLLHPPADTSEP